MNISVLLGVCEVLHLPALKENLRNFKKRYFESKRDLRTITNIF